MNVSKEHDAYFSSRQRMVEEQIRQRKVSDERVLQAVLRVKRHLFVGGDFKESVYEDRPLGIGYGQTISQPYMAAFMTEVLDLLPLDRVLEIGTGCGYQAAVLAELAGEVYTIESIKPLAEEARKRLSGLDYENIWIKHGDGYEGWVEHAPYDAIIVTAAPQEIPPKLVEQLKVGGRMVLPVGGARQDLYLITKTPQGIRQEVLFPVKFVPMVKGAHGLET